MIRSLPARYPELGRIRFGDKGPKGAPRKGKFLRFSSNDEVVLKALASQHGGDVTPWAGGEQAFHLTTETSTISVLLPADPIDTWYERWGSGGIQRRCDGERCTQPVINADGGFMEETDCACIREFLTPGDTKEGACAVTVRLRVVIPDVPGIGVWMATSHSVYAAMELPGQVQLLEAMRERGQLVPAELAIDFRTEKKPWEKFKRDYIVPVLRIRSSLTQLGAGQTVGEITSGGGSGTEGRNGPPAGDAGNNREPPATTPAGVIPGGGELAARAPAAPPASITDAPIPDAALASIRRLAERKGIDDAELTFLAGKALDTLTLDDANALTKAVTAAPKLDDGRAF